MLRYFCRARRRNRRPARNRRRVRDSPPRSRSCATRATLEPRCEDGATNEEAYDGATLSPEEAPARMHPSYRPTLFIYEYVPGGTGLAERIWEQRDALASKTLRMIETCPCTSGCPSCVGPGEAFPKQSAIELLRWSAPKGNGAAQSPIRGETHIPLDIPPSGDLATRG